MKRVTGWFYFLVLNNMPAYKYNIVGHIHISCQRGRPKYENKSTCNKKSNGGTPNKNTSDAKSNKESNTKSNNEPANKSYGNSSSTTRTLFEPRVCTIRYA